MAIDDRAGSAPGKPEPISARWLDESADGSTALEIYPGDDLGGGQPGVVIEIYGLGDLVLSVDGALDLCLRMIGAICRLKRAAPLHEPASTAALYLSNAFGGAVAGCESDAPPLSQPTEAKRPVVRLRICSGRQSKGCDQLDQRPGGSDREEDAKHDLHQQSMPRLW